MTTDDDLDRLAADVGRTRAQLGETVAELRRRLDPQTLKRQVNDMVRSTDGSMGLAETLRTNPIPLAMIGIGIGWLLLRGTGGGSGGYGGQIYDWAERNTAGTRSRVQHAMDRVSETAHDVTDKASGTLQQMRDRVTGEHGGPAERDTAVRGAAGWTGAEAGRGTLHADTSHRSGVPGASTIGRIRDTASRSTGGLWHLVDDHPLAAGLMGLALGAAVGAAIPSTDTENEWVGEWGDELRHRGSDYGADLIERGSSVATAALQGGIDAAKAEIGQSDDEEQPQPPPSQPQPPRPRPLRP